MPKVSSRRGVEQQAEQQEALAATKESGGGFNEQVVAFFKKELDVDIIEVYKALKSVSEIPSDQMTDRMVLAREINTAARRSRESYIIFLKARRERELFRIEYAAKMKGLNKRAIEKIEAWMRAGEIKQKQITKDMVDNEIAADPELGVEYRELVEKEQDIVMIRDDCERLAMEWSERKRTLQTQAKLITAEKEHVFGSPREE